MELPRLKNLSVTLKLFISLFVLLTGINYVVLLIEIYMDTQMSVTQIIAGYRTFETIELLEHTFKYLFWFIFAFGIMMTIFLLGSSSEGMKKFFVILVPLAITLDLSAMWLVRFSEWFGYQMFGSGFFLALSFLFMLLVVFKELWYQGS